MLVPGKEGRTLREVRGAEAAHCREGPGGQELASQRPAHAASGLPSGPTPSNGGAPTPLQAGPPSPKPF